MNQLALSMESMIYTKRDSFHLMLKLHELICTSNDAAYIFLINYVMRYLSNLTHHLNNSVKDLRT